jgi:hypothetical protein
MKPWSSPAVLPRVLVFLDDPLVEGSLQQLACSPVFILLKSSLSTVSLSSQSRSFSSTVSFFPCIELCCCWLSKFFFENLLPGSIKGRKSGCLGPAILLNSSSSLSRFSSLTYSIDSRKNYSMSLRWSSTIWHSALRFLSSVFLSLVDSMRFLCSTSCSLMICSF